MALWSDIFSVPTREAENVGLDLLGMIFNPTLVYGERFDPNQSSVFMHALGAINIFYFVLMVILLIVLVIYLMSGKGVSILAKEQMREKPYRVVMLLCLYFFAIPLPSVGYLNLANIIYIKTQVRANLAADWIAKRTTSNVIINKMSNQGFNAQPPVKGDENKGTTADAYFLGRFVDAVPIFLCADVLQQQGILSNNARAYQALRACHVPSPAAEDLQGGGAKYSTNSYGDILFDGSKPNTNYEMAYVTELACYYQAYKGIRDKYLQFPTGGSKIILDDFPTIAEITENSSPLGYSTDGIEHFVFWRQTARQIESCILQSNAFSQQLKFSAEQNMEIVPARLPGSGSADQIFTDTAQQKLNRGWVYYPMYATYLLEGRQDNYWIGGNSALKSYQDLFKATIQKPDYQSAFGDKVEDVILSTQQIEKQFGTVLEYFLKNQVAISNIEAQREEDALLKDFGANGNVNRSALAQTALSLTIIKNRFNKFTDMLGRFTNMFADKSKFVGPPTRMTASAQELRAAYKNFAHVTKLDELHLFRGGFKAMTTSVRQFISITFKTNEMFKKVTDTMQAQMEFTQKTVDSLIGWAPGFGGAVANLVGGALTIVGALALLAKKLVMFALTAVVHILSGVEGRILYIALLLVFAVEYLPMLAVSLAALILAMQVAAWSVGITLAIIVAPIPNSRVGEGVWRYTLATFLTPSLVIVMYFLTTSITDFAMSYSIAFVLGDMQWSTASDWIEAVVDILTGGFILRLILACLIYVFMIYQSSRMILVGSDFILERLGLGYRSEGFSTFLDQGAKKMGIDTRPS